MVTWNEIASKLLYQLNGKPYLLIKIFPQKDYFPLFSIHNKLLTTLCQEDYLLNIYQINSNKYIQYWSHDHGVIDLYLQNSAPVNRHGINSIPELELKFAKINLIHKLIYHKKI